MLYAKIFSQQHNQGVCVNCIMCEKLTLKGYFVRVKEAEDRLGTRDGGVIVYRGHSNLSYQLVPSLFREGNENIRALEGELFREIETTHPREFIGMNTIDKLAMLQHYSFPTRIMDFTFDSLVALFFAVASLTADNGTVLVCKIPEEQVKQYDDEAVVLLANLAKLSQQERQDLTEENILDCFRGMRAICWDGLPSRHPGNAQGKLVNFLLEDMPRFNYEELEKGFSLSKPLFVRTKQFNPRIIAQRGAFLIFGKDYIAPDMTVEKINIRSDDKYNLKEELKGIGISYSSMFPEFEHFLTHIRDEANNRRH